MDRHSQEMVIDGILDAAVGCVPEPGVDKVRLTQTAACAGVSTRTVNRHYPEKDGLLSDASSRFLCKIYTPIVEDNEKTDKTGETGLGRLLLFLRMWKAYYRTNTVEALLFAAAGNGVMQRLMRMYPSEAPQRRRGGAFDVFDGYIDMLVAYVRR